MNDAPNSTGQTTDSAHASPASEAFAHTAQRVTRTFTYVSSRPSWVIRAALIAFIIVVLLILAVIIIPALIVGILVFFVLALLASIKRALFGGRGNRPPAPPDDGRENVRVLR